MDNWNNLSTKDKIHHTAVKMFSRNGYHGVSLQDIADVVGIKKSSIYNHFTCKEDIINQIYLKFMETLIETTPSKDLIKNTLDNNPSVEDFWKDRIKTYFKNSVISEAGQLWAVIFMEQFRDEKAGALIIEENQRMINTTSMILKIMIKRRLIRKADPELIAAEFIYAIRALHYEYIIRHTYQMDTASCLNKVMEHIDFFFSRCK